MKYWKSTTPEKVWLKSLEDLEAAGIYDYERIKFDDIEDTQEPKKTVRKTK